MNETASRDWARRIVIGLILTVPFVYSVSFRDYTFPPKLMLLQVGTLVGLLLSMANPRHVGPVFKPVLISVLAFIAFAAVSSFWATDPVPSVLAVARLLTGMCLLLLVLTTHLSTNLPAVACALALAGTGVAVLGIVQHLGFWPIAIPSAGLPSATLGYRNIAAMVAIQTLPFACYLMIDTHKRTGWAATIAAGLIAGFLVLTRTRGAWLGGLLGLCLVIVLILATRRDLLGILRARVGHFLVAGMIVLATATLPSGLTKMGPQSIDEKKTTVGKAVASVLDTGGDRGRLTVWRCTLDMVRDHPIAGVGAGNWAVHYPRYDRGQTITFTEAPERPHNLFLSILSELGIIGLVLWLTALALVFHSAWGPLKKRQHATPWLTLACVWSLVAILIHACFSFPMERVTPTFYLWLVIAMMLVLGTQTARGGIGGIWIRATLLVAVLLPFLTYRWMGFEQSVANATLEERRSRWDSVAAHTAEALAKGRFHPEASHLHGYALNTTGQFEKARTFYSEEVVRRPNDLQILNGYAIALQNTGAYSDAETTFLSALRLVDDAPDLYYNLGSLYLAMERFPEASTAYEQVRRLEADSADLLFRLGNARAMAQQDSAAIDVLEQARELYPGRSDVYFVLGELYYRNQILRKAHRAFRDFLDRAPGPSKYADVAKDRLNTLSLTQP